LSIFVFRPLVKIIKLRREKTTGLLDKALSVEESIKARLDEYEKRLMSARAVLAEEYNSIKSDASREEARIKNETREEALKMYQDAIGKILDSKKSVLKELNKDIPRIASEIVARVKGE